MGHCRSLDVRHLMEISKLRAQLAESESVRKSIEDNYKRLQQAISQLPESVQDDIADLTVKLRET